MRVISGTAKGRRLKPVPGEGTRPILDRVKTALFDVLAPRLPGARVFDMFAGTGQIGIEALSRGAASCVFVDVSREAVDTIRANLAATGLSERAEVRRADAFAYVRKPGTPFDLLYVAPPQYQGLWVRALSALAERPGLVTDQGIVVAQIDPSEEEEEVETVSLERYDLRRYGRSSLLFYRPAGR